MATATGQASLPSLSASCHRGIQEPMQVLLTQNCRPAGLQTCRPAFTMYSVDGVASVACKPYGDRVQQAALQCTPRTALQPSVVGPSFFRPSSVFHGTEI